MRILASLAVIAAAQLGAAWANGDLNTGPPGASFATIDAETAAACERLCADDTLCMAWSFHANSCELKAIVPAAIVQDGVISGVSMRAPASMGARFEPVAQSEAEPRQFEAPAAPEDDVSIALLGGPSDDPDLRVRLGN